jgi:hypothetical protein
MHGGYSVKKIAVLVCSLSLALFVSKGGAATQDTADSIYRGGPILTMNDATPRAEAVAVRDGRILAVGALSDVMKHQHIRVPRITL